MNELIDLKKIFEKVKEWWAVSLGVFVALIFGILIGIVIVENKILNDCKYLSAFRISEQSFNCVRRI